MGRGASASRGTLAWDHRFTEDVADQSSEKSFVLNKDARQIVRLIINSKERQKQVEEDTLQGESQHDVKRDGGAREHAPGVPEQDNCFDS